MNVQRTFETGDHVVFRPEVNIGTYKDVVFRVTKVNKVTLHIVPLTGGVEAKAKAQYLVHAPDDDTAPKVETPIPADFPPGAVVTVTAGAVKNRRWGYSPDQMFVVLRESGHSRYAVVPLGGMVGGGYWKLPPSVLNIVNTSRIRLSATA